MLWREFNQTNSLKRQWLSKEENAMPNALIISLYNFFVLCFCTTGLLSVSCEDSHLASEGACVSRRGWVMGELSGLFPVQLPVAWRLCGPFHHCLSTSLLISKKCIFIFLSFWAFFFSWGEVEGMCWFPRLGVMLQQKRSKGAPSPRGTKNLHFFRWIPQMNTSERTN